MTRAIRRWAPGAALLGVLLPACNPAGPAAIRAGRADYNMAIQQTNDEQRLLNIVRLRYRDTPFFLEVASLSTNFIVEFDGQATVTIPEAAANTWGLLARAEYTEKPTVTYTPLQGEKFVRQLLSPLDPPVLLLLYHSGWSIDRILRVCLQSMNGLRNAPSASGPTPTLAPEYEEFFEACAILRRLQVEHRLQMGRVTEKGETAIELVIADDGARKDDVARLGTLLGLDAPPRRLRLTTRESEGTGLVTIVPRSLTAAFFYLSQGVEVPPADENRGRVTVTRTPDGARFDWSEMIGDLFRVRSARHRPDNAYVSVNYRGTWFFIDDSDLGSKSTFSMLTQLFALQAGEVKGTGPILTLPVAQ